MKELQATVDQKADAALGQVTTNITAAVRREVDAHVCHKLAEFEEFYRKQKEAR